jgi:general secretion pathway protein D
VLAGMISKTEQKSLSGPPGIGALPVLNKLLSSEMNTDDRTELIIIITPHITRSRVGTNSSSIVVEPTR